MATGQMLFKYGSQGKNLESLLDIFKLFFNPIIFVALCIYGLTTGLWLFILSRVQISFAYPMQALAFPIVLLFSMIIFKENISFTKWVGIMIICLGVFVATRG